jgi:hypothetical protein
MATPTLALLLWLLLLSLVVFCVANKLTWLSALRGVVPAAVMLAPWAVTLLFASPKLLMAMPMLQLRVQAACIALFLVGVTLGTHTTCHFRYVRVVAFKKISC